MNNLDEILSFSYNTIVSANPDYLNHNDAYSSLFWNNVEPIARVFDAVRMFVFKEQHMMQIEFWAFNKNTLNDNNIERLLELLISNYGKDSYGNDAMPSSFRNFRYIWRFLDEKYTVSDDASEDSSFCCSLTIEYLNDTFFMEIENYELFNPDALHKIEHFLLS